MTLPVTSLYQTDLDTLNGWEVERTLDQAMDALRCPPPEALVKNLSGGALRACVCVCMCHHYIISVQARCCPGAAAQSRWRGHTRSLPNEEDGTEGPPSQPSGTDITPLVRAAWRYLSRGATSPHKDTQTSLNDGAKGAATPDSTRRRETRIT